MAVVLVVEDEQLVRALAELILQDAHYETVTAANREEAISHLQSHLTIDVLFTNLGFGKCLEGGIHLAVAARKLRPELPVLYTTGRCVTSGMKTKLVEPSGLLPKPYTADQLSMALDALLRQAGKSN